MATLIMAVVPPVALAAPRVFSHLTARLETLGEEYARLCPGFFMKFHTCERVNGQEIFTFLTTSIEVAFSCLSLRDH